MQIVILQKQHTLTHTPVALGGSKVLQQKLLNVLQNTKEPLFSLLPQMESDKSENLTYPPPSQTTLSSQL